MLSAILHATAETLSSRAPTLSSSVASTALESSALARARRLATELPDARNTSTNGGEMELHEWWLSNAQLLEDARRELGPLHPALYDLEAHGAEFIHPRLHEAVVACEEAARARLPVPEEALRSLLRPAGAPNVWRLPLFTERFCTLLLEELAHYERSGIPLRRPNGMNRFGAILDELGLSASLDYLTRRYLRPLGQMLYPYLIARGDADEHYAFVVRYKRGQDVSLAEHADASVLTLNANLGYRGFRGGALTFCGTRGIDEQPKAVPPSTVDFASDFAPGDAILHLGGQYHAALPLESGERVNLVVWCHAKHEVVRFMPYDAHEQLTAEQRWRAYDLEAHPPAWMSLFAEPQAQRRATTSGASAGAPGAEEAETAEDRAMYDEL